MRLIGHLENESLARTFAAYLYVQGIDNQLEFQKEEGWGIWIRDEDKLEPAANLLGSFRDNPRDPRYHTEAKSASQLRDKEQKDDAAYRKKVRVRRQLFPSLAGYGFGPLTFALIAISVVVFLLSKFASDLDAIRGLFISEQLVDHRDLSSMLPEIRHGQYWRLFTPIFIHMSFLHILFNMLWLRDLGSMIEDRQRPDLRRHVWCRLWFAELRLDSRQIRSRLWPVSAPFNGQHDANLVCALLLWSAGSCGKHCARGRLSRWRRVGLPLKPAPTLRKFAQEGRRGAIPNFRRRLWFGRSRS
jgi:Cytoplasmic N-terminal domain of rhomboid serine protease/Rhomboid family